ncbi:MAG: hypothetical protein AAGC55_28195, partial [Myxococcota bacterium]
MALRFLPTREMVALTRTWVDPLHRDHQILASRPILAALLPEIAKIHHELVRIQPRSELLQLLDEVQDRQVTIDDRHDDLLRCVYHALRAIEYFYSGDEQAEQAGGLRERILPDGLKMVNASYRSEVGHSEMVAAGLGDTDRAMLAQLGIGSHSMLDVVSEWLTVSNQLGQLDHERRGLESRNIGPGRGESSRLRNRWIRMVDLVRRAAALLDRDPDLDGLLARIQRAEDEADRRRVARADDGDDGADGDEADEVLAGEEADS